MKLTRTESFTELELQAGAGADEVRAAYKRLPLQWWVPDKQPVEARQAATARFQRISAAYACLTKAGPNQHHPHHHHGPNYDSDEDEDDDFDDDYDDDYDDYDDEDEDYDDDELLEKMRMAYMFAIFEEVFGMGGGGRRGGRGAAGPFPFGSRFGFSFGAPPFPGGGFPGGGFPGGPRGGHGGGYGGGYTGSATAGVTSRSAEAATKAQAAAQEAWRRRRAGRGAAAGRDAGGSQQPQTMIQSAAVQVAAGPGWLEVELSGLPPPPPGAKEVSPGCDDLPPGVGVEYTARPHLPGGGGGGGGGGKKGKGGKEGKGGGGGGKVGKEGKEGGWFSWQRLDRGTSRVQLMDLRPAGATRPSGGPWGPSSLMTTGGQLQPKPRQQQQQQQHPRQPQQQPQQPSRQQQQPKPPQQQQPKAAAARQQQQQEEEEAEEEEQEEEEEEEAEEEEEEEDHEDVLVPNAGRRQDGGGAAQAATQGGAAQGACQAAAAAAAAQASPLGFVLTYAQPDIKNGSALVNVSALAPSITWQDEHNAVIAYNMTVVQFKHMYILALCFSAAPTITAPAQKRWSSRTSAATTIRVEDAAAPITTAEECLDAWDKQSLDVGTLCISQDADMVIMYEWTVTWRPINHAAALSSPPPPQRTARHPPRRAPPPRFRANRGMLRKRRNA
ncbi:hypothetical protein HXX76_012904 [Chlamydomonas incerta]|uniref:J domain-containing protein n=1 Tax=Chlamydomonas incerta TaxID=51695 RepID=A0A835SKD0_CHLIN|nr:hypothetical protein HXX76_012904 [Chlamydomonas incerta]|eukprot:KAG2426587.1 hypothetical protein HXX76_012904 [Chlamydomonas incerta]